MDVSTAGKLLAVDCPTRYVDSVLEVFLHLSILFQSLPEAMASSSSGEHHLTKEEIATFDDTCLLDKISVLAAKH